MLSPVHTAPALALTAPVGHAGGAGVVGGAGGGLFGSGPVVEVVWADGLRGGGSPPAAAWIATRAESKGLRLVNLAFNSNFIGMESMSSRCLEEIRNDPGGYLGC